MTMQLQGGTRRLAVIGRSPTSEFLQFLFPPLVTSCHATMSAVLPFSFQQQQKSAQEYIASVPVIEVNGNVAVCDGGQQRNATTQIITHILHSHSHSHSHSIDRG